MTHDETDFTIPNLGTPLGMARHYDSQNTVASGSSWSDRGMGDGWSFTYSDRLVSSTGNPADTSDPSELVWFTDSGVELKFVAQGTGWKTPTTIFGTLTHDTTNHWYVWTDKAGNILRFDDGYGGGTSGRLLYKLDRYLDGVEVFYKDGTTEITSVQRVLGGVPATGSSAASLAFTYVGSHITAITDSTGRTWTYAYDSAGRLASVTAPLDNAAPLSVVRYGYYGDTALNDLLQSVTDPDDNVTQFSYYANRRGFQVTDAQGNTHSLFFNLYRGQTSFTDERGQVTYYTCDGDGNLIEQLNPDQTTTTSTWQNDLKTSDTDAYGQTTSDYYDSNGNVVDTTDPLENVVYSTYSTPYANPLQTTKLGRPATWQVLTFPVQSSQHITVPTGGASVTLTGNVAAAFNVTYTVDATTMLSFDFSSPTNAAAPGQIQSMGFDTSGSSPTWSREFQLAGTDTSTVRQYLNSYSPAAPGVKHFVIPIGQFYTGSMLYLWFVNQTSYSTGQSIFSNVHLFEAVASTTSYAYSGDGTSLTLVTDADGNRTTYTYPSPNRGLPATMTAPNGYGRNDGGCTTTYSYNDAGQTTSQTSQVAPGQSITQTWHYDDGAGSRGYLTSSTDGNGNTTFYAYDLVGHLLSTTQPDPDGASGPLPAPVTIYVHDAAGNLISTSLATASPQQTTSTVYDAMGRVVKTVNPDGTYTTDQYDSAGNIVYSTDAMGRVTQYYLRFP